MKSLNIISNIGFDALNAQGHEQQLNSILKVKYRGLISEKEYQQRIAKHNQMQLDQKSYQLKFSIPIGD
ncbi:MULTISPECIES: hypothetical protein [Acinetobacter]|uniref:hypothetical protein n=1 Tax=Acinetobacter TaxID=469 RepID=UPI0021CD486D|nr:hypothetical protein [Acinetobacter dispersus]